MQIALAAVVVFAGMWFAVLRPKADTGTAPAAAPVAAPAPGVAGLSRAVDKAHGAAAASDAANAATQAASGEASAPTADATAAPAAKAPATKAKAATAAKPSATKAAGTAKADASVDKSERLLAKLAKGKTVVMAFYGKGADDRAARRAVRRATHGRHDVVVGSAPITKVGQYAAMTSDVDVLTSPTVLVIGKDREAVALTGYLDQRNIAQAIGDARRAAKKPAAKK